MAEADPLGGPGAVEHEGSGSWRRPRGQAWGNEAQRAVLHAVAEDVARRTRHKVVAIEALRSDGYLEFVAIAGDAAAEAKMLGRASPLALEHIRALGVEMDGWRHIPSERLDDVTRAWLDEYGYTPDVPASGLPHGWHPDDQMVRLLENEDGELRGLLYLDEPLSGLRPTPESVAEMNAEIEVMYDAVVSLVEREHYGEQVRMVTQARSAIASVRPGLGVEELLSEMSRAMVAAMDVDVVDVITEATDVPGLEVDRSHVTELMRRQWRRRGHFVVERARTWGMGEEPIPTPPSLARLMTTHGLGSGLLVPIGAGEEYLGTLALGRAVEAPRWIASEIMAATVVAADLARLVLEARLMERERLLNAQLRDLVAHRRDMVNTLAHELRTPVSVMRMHLELLADDPPQQEVEQSRAAMDRSARRIEDMIEDLMALATVSNSEIILPQTSVDLSSVTRETCDFLAGVASSAGITLETGIVDDLVVTGDESGLQRMLGNLVSNAIKYTPAGGCVTVSLAPVTVGEGDGVRLTCTDTGIGIAPSDVDHVFTPFFRSSRIEARDRPGTGLGLAITERVVQRHQGTVEVRSELGVGTTFAVWLPVAAESDVG